MEDITIKSARLIESNRMSLYYTRFNNNFWYDWFSNSDTLGGKLKSIILPIIRKLPKEFDDYYVWCKESIPMWCDGYVYNIFICKNADDPSRIRFSKSKTGIELYIYDYIDTNKILLKKEYSNLRELSADIKNGILENYL